jgi:hypothetical protein
MGSAEREVTQCCGRKEMNVDCVNLEGDGV